MSALIERWFPLLPPPIQLWMDIERGIERRSPRRKLQWLATSHGWTEAFRGSLRDVLEPENEQRPCRGQRLRQFAFRGRQALQSDREVATPEDIVSSSTMIQTIEDLGQSTGQCKSSALGGSEELPQEVQRNFPPGGSEELP